MLRPGFRSGCRKNFRSLRLFKLGDFDQVERQIRDAEIVVTWSFRPEQFSAATKLRWIHSPAAAVHQLMFPELIESDVILTNGREVHGATVAEHVIALIFALAKKLPLAMRCQEKHVWGQNQLESQPQPREVAGTTLGLVGLGSIGTEVAKRASALGMRVIAVRNRVEADKPDNVEQVYASSQIDSMLSQSDYVVLAAPLLTSSTAGMINAARLGIMKKDGYLINVSRGPLVDESALAEALRSRKIAGAGLDVFEKEPLPPESPLWDLENLLITRTLPGLRRSYGISITRSLPKIYAAI